jgi:sugar lactone lactonase YvrE
VDTEHLYWANHFEPAAEGYIGRANPDGSAADARWLRLGGEMPQGVAVSPAAIYWSSNYATTEAEPNSNGGQLVGRVNLNGSGLTRVIVSDGGSDEGRIRSIALDAGHVYWVKSRVGDGRKFTIGRADLSLGEVEKEFLPVEGAPIGLALDPEHLYWSLNGEPVPNPGTDLYRFEPEAPAGHRLTDLSVDAGAEAGAEARGLLGTSADGSRVYFAANGVLDNTPNEAGEVAAPGNCRGGVDHENPGCETNLYLSRPDPGAAGQLETVFVAPVTGADRFDWRPNAEEESHYYPRTSRVTPAGDTLLFASVRNLTGYDAHGTSELYLYREGQGILCVSCNPSGESPRGFPDLGERLQIAPLEPQPAPTLARNLSSTGQRVFFETTDTLLPEDANGEGGCPVIGSSNAHPNCLSVYEWEADGAGSCHSNAENGGCLYLLSPPTDTDASFLGDASASGDDVFLFTRVPLVGQDTDHLLDLYDAHVDGGLPAQSRLPAGECESAEACHGPAGGADEPPSPATSSFQGPPDPSQKHPHKHKKHKHKKKHHRHRSHGRAHR